MDDEAVFDPLKGKTPIQKFCHYLHDTLILLGAPAELADVLERPDAIAEGDIAALRGYTCGLIDATKQKLVDLHKLEVVVDQSQRDRAHELN